MWIWDERELSARVRQALVNGHGDLAPSALIMPAASPGDPECERLERAGFAQLPAPVLPLGQAPSRPGFERVDCGTTSYLVARKASGDLALYANRCPHRGAELACAAGAAKAACPYHGWTYDLDGRLCGIYGLHHGVGSSSGLGLKEVMSASAGGFLWRTEGAPEGRGATLEHLGAFHRWEAPRVLGEFSVTGAFNWKIGVETFLETYHFAAAHRETLGSLEVKNITLFDAGADQLRFIIPWRRPAGAGEDIRSYCHFMYFFYPNTFFIVFEGHFGWISIEPLGPRASRLVHRGLSPVERPDPGLVQKIEASLAFLEVVEREDAALCEAVQRGLEPGAEHCVTRYEPGVQWFRERRPCARLPDRLSLPQVARKL